MRKLLRTSGSIIAVLAGMSAAAAFAQDNAKEAPGPGASQGEIVVTGTRRKPKAKSRRRSSRPKANARPPSSKPRPANGRLPPKRRRPAWCPRRSPLVTCRR